ncbi:MAG: lysine biosynthesis protein LysW [Myxococcales bacterium]|nr:lysine biosynthesis protein LysW [Myxococcales bacterium]
MNTVECPECGVDVVFPDGTILGEVLTCDNCGAMLDVVSLDPPEVMLFEEEEK